jgi:membrane protease YdiL (CAAX protease family)
MQRKHTVLSSGLLVLIFIVWLLASSVIAALPIVLMTYMDIKMSKYARLVIFGAAELLLIVPLIGYMAITGTSVRALIGNRTNAAQLAFAALIGVLLAPALQGVDSVMMELFHLLGAHITDSAMITPDTVGQMLVGFVTIGIFAGVVEEPIFRGVVQRGLASAMGKRTAIVLTAFAFSLIHMEVVGFPTRFIIGVVLGYMMWRSGSILPGVFTHAAYNSTLIAMTLLLNAVLPNWNGFNIIRGASEDINGMLTWVLLSIPFALAAWGMYKLFALVTPASAAWADKPYAAKSVKFLHSLPWIAAGFAGLGITAVTVLMMWSDQIQKILNQFMNYYR